MVDIGFMDILMGRSLTSATYHGNTVAVSIDGLSTMTKTAHIFFAGTSQSLPIFYSDPGCLEVQASQVQLDPEADY
eukprot:SAG22_NODE_1970_length_3231_cov_4.101533_2_plen_76_part_00